MLCIDGGSPICLETGNVGMLCTDGGAPICVLETGSVGMLLWSDRREDVVVFEFETADGCINGADKAGADVGTEDTGKLWEDVDVCTSALETAGDSP